MASVGATRTEYQAVTEAAGLLDCSERGKLALSGPDAKAFLQGQVSNDVEALVPGQGCYAVFLTPKGKMLGDLRILDAGDELLLDTERVALQELFNMIRRFSIGYQIELHKRTLERGLLALVGPMSDAIATTSRLPETEHSHEFVDIGGRSARAIRTDVGVDLLCDAAGVEQLSLALRDAGAVPVSAEVVECLRIERGRPRFGIDLDDSVIPQEAGLNQRAVSFTKGCYVGQETVARLFYRGKPNRHLRGLRLSAPARRGDAVSFEGRTVGQLGSVAVSPRLGPIALALVRREVTPGASVAVGSDSEIIAAGGSDSEIIAAGGSDSKIMAAGGSASEIMAEVVELPFS
jgi:folate-binding protein YgfZ